MHIARKAGVRIRQCTEDEIRSGQASVKALRAGKEGDNQSAVPLEKVADYLVEQIVGECDCGDDHSSHGHCIH